MTGLVNSFRGYFNFLSNFYNTKVVYKDVTYKNSEAAYQAQRCKLDKEKPQFVNYAGYIAKRVSKSVLTRPDWHDIKDNEMFQICYQKFMQNDRLKRMLLETSCMYLEEGNTWGDEYWGACGGKDENRLGKILMTIRGILQGDILQGYERHYRASKEEWLNYLERLDKVI